MTLLKSVSLKTSRPKLVFVVALVVVLMGTMWAKRSGQRKAKLRNYCSCLIVENRGDLACTKEFGLSTTFDRVRQSFREGSFEVRFLGSRLGCAPAVRTLE